MNDIEIEQLVNRLSAALAIRGGQGYDKDFKLLINEYVKLWRVRDRLNKMLALNENERDDTFIYSRYDVLEMLEYIQAGSYGDDE